MTDSSPPEEAHDKAWEKAERQFSHKTASQFYDPCQDFADRSLKCLKRNGYDREMCGDYFQYAASSYHFEEIVKPPFQLTLCGMLVFDTDD
ncbi:Cytochrome c oxidase-assembly factor cox23 [Penicillium verhagenii]|uniref:Cytochrome c oxidase-assembly factor cox23 n=1 Tax=Penicillium verhagenii TaxID=1562060 RepID=UPI00254538A9|nr:Cytochrome c oxidase-assembly factor cox23 [Penicillium verhagenii]KAJ5938729.1 Cytochrome c oxidase-assembly factor cox23 [Penicillium verhagenii]